MPIVYVHGVGTRSERQGYSGNWAAIQTYLTRYILPIISSSPAPERVTAAYWGDLGASYLFGRRSRPRSPLLGMGATDELSEAQRAILLAGSEPAFYVAPVPAPARPSPGPLLPAGPVPGSERAPEPRFRLRQLDEDQLSDLLVAEIQNLEGDQNVVAASVAADAVAHTPGLRDRLHQCHNLREEIALVESLLSGEMAADGADAPLLAQGGGVIGPFLARLRDRIRETALRIDQAPGFLASRLAVEVRQPLNDFITDFIGDVFTYLRRRDEPQESIPTRIMDTLATARAGSPPEEPLIVLSHSMGGQIIYDLVTYYLPQSEAHRSLRVDFWCAAASQVGLFAEMGLFRAVRPNAGDAPDREKIPFPDRHHLGGWWNVWDHNDFISYSCRDIVADVDDEGFNNGMSLLGAHSGYLQRPSFYRRFARKLQVAKNEGWHRP